MDHRSGHSQGLRVLGAIAVWLLSAAAAWACTYDSFLERLGGTESGGRYDIENSIGYLGKYQMGELALIDVGLYSRDGTSRNDWRGAWTSRARSMGVNSKQDFLGNGDVQEWAIREYMRIQWGYARSFGLDDYIGQTVGGLPISESAILMGQHLGGIKNMTLFLKTGGSYVFEDDYGTQITTYIRRGYGYQTPWGSTGACGDPPPPSDGDGSGDPYNPPPILTAEELQRDMAACDPVVETALMEAQGMALEQARSDINGSILEPAALKVVSCLNNLMSTGISLSWGFHPPSLSDMFNMLAERACDAMNDLFDEVTEDLRHGFEHAGPLGSFDVRLRRGQGSLLDVGFITNSVVTGEDIRLREAVGQVPQIDIDLD